MRRIPALHKEGVIDVSVRMFCESVRDGLDACGHGDEDAKRKLVVSHVEKVVFDHGKVTLRGSVPVRIKAYENLDQTLETSKLKFKIEGQIRR